MQRLNFNVDYFGYVVGSQSLFYLAGCLALPYTCEVLPRRFLFVISMVGFAVVCAFMGPS